MKKLMLIFLLITSINAGYGISKYTESQTSYCVGWNEGYKDGWCYQDPYCIEPIPPMCPIPRINESSTSYQDGYLRGFVQGKHDRNS